MKQLLFAFILTLFASTGFSQIYKGQWMVGGTASFDYTKHGDGDANKVTTFFVNPDVGYFFADKFAGGIFLTFQDTKVKAADKAFINFAAGPFLRYYFLPAAQKVNVFADAAYEWGKTGQTTKVSYNEYAFMAGPAVFLNEHTALEFALRYGSLGGDFYGSDRQNSFGVNIGFQIHLGSGMKK